MKTLEEIKDSYAKEQGYENWDELCICLFGTYIYETVDNLMKRFAKQTARQALINAANNVDPENCFRYSSERNAFEQVEESILNTFPNYEKVCK